jgi:cysteinyl-tRNA synthetase
MFKLYNTQTKKKEEITPLDGKTIRMYSCGPTVYNFAHIGNLRAFLVTDLLKRSLRVHNYVVQHVMNITDVDDKTIRDSQKNGMTRDAFTKKYEKEFFSDLNTLNVDPANMYPRATENIGGMITMIQSLLDKGIAYLGGDGSIYYAVRKFSGYGKLSHIDVTALQEGASGRVKKDEYTKESVQDFALWKAWDAADGDNSWPATFTVGDTTQEIKGRPGWHIECSVMSCKHLGNHFDIHTGGIDLIFPHHENEIAQSEAANDEPFVSVWVHNEHLLVEGKKMSKSVGNFYTLRDIISKGYDPLAFRYLLLATHYRQKMNFTFDNLAAARNSLDRIQDFIYRMQEVTREDGDALTAKIEEYRNAILLALADDLNTPAALESLFELIGDVYQHIETLSSTEAKAALDVIKMFNDVFAVVQFEKMTLPEDVAQLIKEREEARADKNWAQSDILRDKIKQRGYVIEDTPQGTRWKKASLRTDTDN